MNYGTSRHRLDEIMTQLVKAKQQQQRHQQQVAAVDDQINAIATGATLTEINAIEVDADANAGNAAWDLVKADIVLLKSEGAALKTKSNTMRSGTDAIDFDA